MSATPPPDSADAKQVLKGGLSARHVGPWLARGLYRSGRARRLLLKKERTKNGHQPTAGSGTRKRKREGRSGTGAPKRQPVIAAQAYCNR